MSIENPKEVSASAERYSETSPPSGEEGREGDRPVDPEDALKQFREKWGATSGARTEDYSPIVMELASRRGMALDVIAKAPDKKKRFNELVESGFFTATDDVEEEWQKGGLSDKSASDFLQEIKDSVERDMHHI